MYHDIQSIYKNVHESPFQMTSPLVLLAALSLAMFFTIPSTINPFDSHGWFTHAIPLSQNVAGLDMHIVEEGIHHAHFSAMLLSLLVASMGIGLAVLFYLVNRVDVAIVSGIMKKFKFINFPLTSFI